MLMSGCPGDGREIPACMYAACCPLSSSDGQINMVGAKERRRSGLDWIGLC